MRLTEVLPKSGLPKSGLEGDRCTSWFGTDSEEAFRLRGGLSSCGYGPEDIKYCINSHGFRSREFEGASGLIVLSIGCSWTFGMGVPEEATFHEKIVSEISVRSGRNVTSYNLGVCGGSNDQIARLLHLTVPQLKPNLVLVLFTFLNRREYVTSDNRRISFTPRSTGADPLTWSVVQNLHSLSSRFDDFLNLYRNMRSIEALLADTAWVFSFVDPSDLEEIPFDVDHKRLAVPQKKLDKGRDEMHPGPKTHEAIAKSFQAALWKAGVIQDLSRVDTNR